MEVNIRKEKSSDFEIVHKLIKSAFINEEYSNQNEHSLVRALRNSEAFIPELSLVAEINGQIVGHILLTKVLIGNENHQSTSLSLAPVSVLPEFQKKGIGSQLIEKAHSIAEKLGYASVVVLGHADYYPKFGYKIARNFGIEFPFEVPEKNCFALELKTSGLQGVHGKIAFPPAFYEFE